MKTEDIDKRIGMPDVDEEWAHFEHDVIDKDTGASKRLWLWSLSIAASIIIVAGLFMLRHESNKQEPLLAEHPTELEEPNDTTKIVVEPVAEPRKELSQAETPHPSRTQKKENAKAGLFNYTEPLQGEIAGKEAIDANYNDSILVMLDGIRLPDSLCTRHFIFHGGIHAYLEKKGLKVDKIVHLSNESISMNENEKAKQRYLQYIEMYGRLAELGVAEITTCNDSLNEVFILQHPELMKTHRRVEGYVFDDETNKAIEYAMINYIHKGKYKGFVASDSLGHFVLWVPQFADTLKAKHVGYQDAIFQPADTTVVIRLKDKIIKDLKRDIKF